MPEHESLTTPPPASPTLHRLVVLTAVLTFPLVWLGGLVTSHAAGMSVPDWPNSYGYNMFALPFSMWLSRTAGGAFYEHSHRLLGSLVGLSALAAAMYAWGVARSEAWHRRLTRLTILGAIGFVLSFAIARGLRAAGTIGEAGYQRSTHIFAGFAMLAIVGLVGRYCRRERDPVRVRRTLVTLLLLAISLQGAMGGLRVDRISLTLAKMHGIFGQFTFAFAAVVATVCSRWWSERAALPIEAGRWVRRLAVLVVLLALTQLTLGALMRHDPKREANASAGDASAGLAIPDWPLHYGKLLPPTDAAGLAEVNAQRIYKLGWPPVTLGQIWLHFAHRCGAYLTTLTVGALVAAGFRARPSVRRPIFVLGGLVLAQVTLGVLTVLERKAADIATLHQACGALLLMTASLVVARAYRLYRLPSAAAETIPAEADLPAGAAVAGLRHT